MKTIFTLLALSVFTLIACKEDEDAIQPAPVNATTILAKMHFAPVVSGSQNSGTRFTVPLPTTISQIKLMRRDTILDTKTNVMNTVDLYDTLMKRFPLHDSTYTFRVAIGKDTTEAIFKMP